MFKEQDDDEILVYDWGKSNNPRPAGTTRLLDRPMPNFSATPNWAAPPAYPNHFVGHFNRYEETLPYQAPTNSYTYPYNCNNYMDYNFSPQPSYYNTHNPQRDYRHNYPEYSSGAVSETFKGSHSPWSWETEKPLPPKKASNEDDDWLDIEEIDYSAGRLRNEIRKKHSENKSGRRKRVETHSSTNRCPSPLLDEVEEIDYTEKSDRNALGSVTVEKEAVSLPIVLVEPSILDVPKSNLSLNDVLPEISHEPKKGRPIAIRNSRKRTRNDLDKSENSNLEDLLAKTKHRVSARSYAKPTRKVGCTVSTAPPKDISVDDEARDTISTSCSNKTYQQSQSAQLSSKGNDELVLESVTAVSFNDNDNQSLLTSLSQVGSTKLSRLALLPKLSDNDAAIPCASSDSGNSTCSSHLSSLQQENLEDSVGVIDISESDPITLMDIEKSMQEIFTDEGNEEDSGYVETQLKIRTDIFEVEEDDE